MVPRFTAGCCNPNPNRKSSTTTAKPLARLTPLVEGARASGFATAKLHHYRGRDQLIPYAVAEDIRGFVVARGPIATVEIGAEVKILAKAMIKQIDRVINDLQNQKQQFERAGGNPISLGIVGINQADHYISYEGDVAWPTGTRGNKHPIQEAAEAGNRLRSRVASLFDEFLILRFRAWNEPPYRF